MIDIDDGRLRIDRGTQPHLKQQPATTIRASGRSQNLDHGKGGGHQADISAGHGPALISQQSLIGAVLYHDPPEPVPDLLSQAGKSEESGSAAQDTVDTPGILSP
ncbi:hypothetical protein GCM10027575_01910 [Phytohabitans suffuscus]